MKPSLALLLFASTALLADTAASPPVKSACGPDQIAFNVKSGGVGQTTPNPAPGKALVNVIEEFYRPPNELGAPTVRVGVDGSWIGANRGTSHLSFAVEPGDRHFCVDWQSPPRGLPPMVGATSLTAEAGKTYYFRARILEHPGPYWTLSFELLNNDEGRELAARTPRSESTPKQ
ncbi:MAG: hypothetical protein ACLP59_04020 [Bryobacteraceae bacterium]